MQAVIKEYEAGFRKPAISQVRSGDTVKVHQLIREGAKQRTQSFTGTVIRTSRMSELSAAITVRWIASGVGVEKIVPLHSPTIKKVEVLKRGKVRRNYLSYLRNRSGRSARLSEREFDRDSVNVAEEAPKTEAEVAQQATTEGQTDAEVTEIKQDSSVMAEESIEKAAKQEDKEASADEPGTDPDAATDEAQLPTKEVKAGQERAESEDSKAQGTTE